MTAYDDLLSRAHAHALDYLHALPERRVGSTATRDELMAALRTPLSGPGEAPEAVLDLLASQAPRGAVACNSPRYFGFVIGGAHAGVARRRLARVDVGPERGHLRDLAAGLGRRGSRGRVVARPVRSAARFRRRLRHRLPDGELHVPGRRAPRRVAARGLGCRERRLARRAAHQRRRLRRIAHHHRCRAALSRPGHEVHPARRIRCAGPHEARRVARAARNARRPDHRLRAGRQREHRRRSIRCAKSAKPATRTARGCTSTARSACGRVRARVRSGAR